jgi:hypothetical protein
MRSSTERLESGDEFKNLAVGSAGSETVKQSSRAEAP